MDEWGKENPQSEGILADDSELGGYGVAALPGCLARYGEAHRRTQCMVDYALDQSEKVLGRRLAKCGDWLVFRHYYTIDEVRLHAADFCCKHLLCPFCAIRRGAKYLRAYLGKLN